MINNSTEPQWPAHFVAGIALFIFVSYSVFILVGLIGLIQKKGPFFDAVSTLNDKKELTIGLSRFQLLMSTVFVTSGGLYQLATPSKKVPQLSTQGLLLLGFSLATYLGAKLLADRRRRLEAEAARLATMKQK